MQLNRGGIDFLPNGLPEAARPRLFTADNAGEFRSCEIGLRDKLR